MPKRSASSGKPPIPRIGANLEGGSPSVVGAPPKPPPHWLALLDAQEHPPLTSGAQGKRSGPRPPCYRTGVAAERTQRTNEQWLADLRSPAGPFTEAALADLRALVAAAVRAAVGGSRAGEGMVEDLTQVAQVHVLRQLAHFEGRSRFTTWVYAVAVRAALSELRRAAYRGTAEPLPGEDDAPASPSASPSAHAARNEIVALIHRVIERDLTERQRAALLGELDGKPRAELAAGLGTNPNALAKLLFDARERLVVGLRNAGITDEEVREVFEL